MGKAKFIDMDWFKKESRIVQKGGGQYDSLQQIIIPWTYPKSYNAIINTNYWVTIFLIAVIILYFMGWFENSEMLYYPVEG